MQVPFFVLCLLLRANLVIATDRWGPQLEKATYKNRQRLYLSEQASLLVSISISYVRIDTYSLLT